MEQNYVINAKTIYILILKISAKYVKKAWDFISTEINAQNVMELVKHVQTVQNMIVKNV